MDFVVFLFLFLGVVFGVIGNVGILLLPDVYTRLQASSTAGTTSVVSALIAAMFVTGWSPMTGKIAVIALFFFVSSPISSHIIARYAWQLEMIPWRRSFAEREALREKYDE